MAPQVPEDPPTPVALAPGPNALTQVPKNPPGASAPLSPTYYPPDAHPALLYLAQMQGQGRATMHSCLAQLAFLASDGRCTAESLPWHELRYGRTSALWSRLHEVNDKEQKLAPATIRKYLSALRGVLHAARRLGYMTAEDYFAAIDLPRVRGETLPGGRSLSKEEIAALLTACEHDASPEGIRDLALLYVVAYTGLRLEEIQNVPLPPGDTLCILGKGNVERQGFLPDTGLLAVRAWIAIRGAAPGPLFLRIRNGKTNPNRLTPSITRSILQRRGEGAGIGRFTPHDLRRTFATQSLDDGADLAKVSRLMGHKNIKTTMRYDKRPEHEGREVVRKLAVAYGHAMRHAEPHLSVLEIFGENHPRFSTPLEVHRGWGVHRLQEAVEQHHVSCTPIPLAEEEIPIAFAAQFSGGEDHRELCARAAKWLDSKDLLWSPRRNQCTYPSVGVADVMSTDGKIAVECGGTEPTKIVIACDEGTSVLFVPFYWQIGLSRPTGFLFERDTRPENIGCAWWKAQVNWCRQSCESWKACRTLTQRRRRDMISREEEIELACIYLASADGAIACQLGVGPDLPEEVRDYQSQRQMEVAGSLGRASKPSPG